jgi:hypothetical protein
MFIQKFISNLNSEIRNKIKNGFLKKEYFTTCDFNYQSEVHSRFLSLIVKICHNLGFDSEIERGFNYNNNGKIVRFKPDVALYKDNKLHSFIEYESTNSSDGRFYDFKRGTCDLRCIYKYSLSNPNNLPLFWIIISTLPKQNVYYKSWKSWDFKKKDRTFKEVIKSPYRFYFPKYISETKKIVEKINIKTKIVLLNIDNNKIIIEKIYN